MSGDLPIRKARTKREKNKSYNDSRNKFRASLKPERNDSSPSEDDDKIKEKKMKVEGTGHSTAHNMSEDNDKEVKHVDEVDEKVAKKLTETKEKPPVAKEQKDIKTGQYIDKETGNPEEISTADTTKKVSEHQDKAQGSSDMHVSEEKKGQDNEKSDKKELESDDCVTWDEMFDSDEDGKAIHAKGSKKYFQIAISTPPAKTTSEEENTDDEEQEDKSDATQNINSKKDRKNHDKDNEGSGGGASSFKNEKEGDGNGDSGEGTASGKDGDDMMTADDNEGGAGGGATEGADDDQKSEIEDDEVLPEDYDKDTSNEQFSDEEMEGGDYSTGELNLEGVVDPYDFTDEEVEEDSYDDDRYYDERFYDGASDNESDFSGGEFHDEEYHGEEFHEEAPTAEVRGAG